MNTSTQHIFWRLMWKEYRSQRGLWLGVAALAVFVQAVMLAVLRNEREIITSLYGVAWLLPILYALGSSAVLFAAEKEDGTFELLRTLPVTPTRLFVGKMSFCLATCVAMILLLNALAWVFAAGEVPSIAVRDLAHLAELFPAVLVVGVFFSLMLNRVLNVIVATIVTVLVLNLNDMHLFKWTGIVAFLVADGVLVRRWFLDGSLVQDRAGHWIDRIAGGISFLRPRVLMAKADTSPPWWRTWKRSLWLEFSHARRTLFVWFPLSAVLVFISPWTYRLIGVDFSYLILPLAPLFLGLAVFRGHQHDGRIRFLTERGVPPQLVWVSSQAMWVGITVLILSVLSMIVVYSPYIWGMRNAGNGVFADLADRYFDFTGVYPQSDWFYRERWVYFVQFGFMLEDDYLHRWSTLMNAERLARIVRFFVWWSTITFFAGQLCSLKFARTVVAVAAGTLLSTFAVFWLALMERLPVPFELSIVPIVLFWIVLSYAGLRRWSLGVSTTRTKLQTAAMFVAFHAAVVLAVIGYRVKTVPAAPVAEEWVAEFTGAKGPSLDLPAGMAPMDYERLYIEADAMIPKSKAQEDADDGEPKYNTPEWFAQHHAAVPVLLKAIEAERIPNPRNLTSGALNRFKDLLLQSAQQLTNAGQLDEALDRYANILEFARLMAMADVTFEPAPEAYVMHWEYGLWFRRDVYKQMVTWAAHDEQTPERIRRGIALLAEHEAAYPPIQQAWGVAYRQDRDVVVYDREERRSAFHVFWRGLPWEKARLLRIMDQEAWELNQRLDRIHERGVLSHPRWRIDWSQLARDFRFGQRLRGPHADDGIARWPVDGLHSTFERLLTAGIDHIMHYRAARVRLELLALRLEQGSLPMHLGAALPTLDPIDLIDPWSGHEFGYYPEGIPHMFRSEDTIAAQTPFLWSVGRGNRDLIAEESPSDGSLTFLATDGRRDYNYERYRDESPLTSPLYQHSDIFPIPTP